MTVSMIVAVAANNIIGKDNQMPWHLPNDLKYFKRTTLNHHIIMGRKNFEAMNCRPLPKRTNIVLTRQEDYQPEGAVVMHTLKEALKFSQENGEEEAFIIGGGEIYRLGMGYADKIYLTRLDLEVEKGDVKFPKMDERDWRLISEEKGELDDKNKISHEYLVYERVTKKTRLLG